jgi:hypothetical protein
LPALRAERFFPVEGFALVEAAFRGVSLLSAFFTRSPRPPSCGSKRSAFTGPEAIARKRLFLSFYPVQYRRTKNNARTGYDATGSYFPGGPISLGIPLKGDAGAKMAKSFN